MVKIPTTGIFKSFRIKCPFIKIQKFHLIKFKYNNFIFLFVLFLIFYLNLFAGIQSSEFKNLFNNVKIIRILCDESYGKIRDYTIKSDFEHLLKTMGYATVEEDATYYDATLKVKIKGKPLGDFYQWEAGFGKVYYIYAGASIKGETFFEIGGIRSKIIRFSGKIKPPKKIETYGEPSEEKDHAPFREAFLASGGLSEFLRQIADLSGPDRLGAILGSRDLEAVELVSNILAKMPDPLANKILVEAMLQHGEHVAEIIAQTLDRIGWQPTTNEENAAFLLAKGKFEKASSLGEAAVRPLIAVLKYDSDSWQEKAALALGEIGDPKTVEPLLEALADANCTWNDLCKAILEAFVKIGKPGAEKLVVALKNDNYDVRKYSIEALKRIGWQPGTLEEKVIWFLINRNYEVVAELGKPAVPTIVSMLKHADFYVRRCAAQALGEIGDPSATQQLIALFKDEDKDIRLIVIIALGRIGGAEAESQLIKALRDKSAEVRAEAVKALIKIAGIHSIDSLIKSLSYNELAVQVLLKIGEPAVEPLIEALKYENYRANAALALGEIGDKKAVAYLKKYLSDSESKVRENVAIALGRMGDKKAIKPFITELKDESSFSRKYAAEALGKIKHPYAVEPLIATLKDEAPYVRRKVAEALGEIRDSRAVEPLIASLKDEDDWVRRNAAESLGKIKDPRAVEPLIVALEDENWDVQWKAALALGEIRDSRAVEPLVDCLKDKSVEVRSAAARVLGKIKDKRAVEALIQALKDEYWLIRRNVVEALGEIKASQAIEPLINALKDEELNVRKEAALSLKKMTGKDFGKNILKWQKWWEVNKEKFLKDN